jgi:hypothetical protein
MPPRLKSASLLLNKTMAKCLFLIPGALRVAEFGFAEDPAQFLPESQARARHIPASKPAAITPSSNTRTETYLCIIVFRLLKGGFVETHPVPTKGLPGEM